MSDSTPREKTALDQISHITTICRECAVARVHSKVDLGKQAKDDPNLDLAPGSLLPLQCDCGSQALTLIIENIHGYVFTAKYGLTRDERQIQALREAKAAQLDALSKHTPAALAYLIKTVSAASAYLLCDDGDQCSYHTSERHGEELKDALAVLRKLRSRLWEEQ